MNRTPSIKVLIADDHPLFRESLRKLLESEPGLLVVGEATGGADALKLARELRPDISRRIRYALAESPCNARTCGASWLLRV